MDQSPQNSFAGTLMRVSTPREISAATHQGVSDLFMLGIKTKDGDRIMFSLTTDELGWFGDLNKSKVWWWNFDRKREIKTSIKNLERYIGTKVRVEGVKETIDEKTQKFRLRNVNKLVLFLE